MRPRFLLPGRLVTGLVLGFCLTSAVSAQDGQPPPGVDVVTLRAAQITLTTTLPGRVVASATAEVRPQVAGIITERAFREGATVTTGDILYKIDPATYDAAVARAEAAVAQAQAELDAAEKDAGRIDELSSRNVASEQAADQADAARASAAANLQAAEAQLVSAQIERDRTTIRARLSGEIGRSLTSPGALVTESQAEPLAVIRNIDPVFVDVTQSAAELLEWRRGHAGAAIDERDRIVKLTLADGSTFDQTGTLTAAEPSVDEQTGVVVLRMEFSNPEKLLLPGMYVQVEMPTRTVENALLVPQEAVSRDRRGQATALVVGPDDVVEQRVLTIMQDRGADWIVSDGVAAGDRVIVAGLQKIAPGATVVPEERGASAASSEQGSAPSGDAASQPQAGSTEAADAPAVRNADASPVGQDSATD